MIKHLDETTNVVKSNRKLIVAAFFVAINVMLPESQYLLAGSFSVIIISTAALFYQINGMKFYYLSLWLSLHLIWSTTFTK